MDDVPSSFVWFLHRVLGLLYLPCSVDFPLILILACFSSGEVVQNLRVMDILGSDLEMLNNRKVGFRIVWL